LHIFEKTRVTGFEQDGSHVTIATDRETFQARVLVGADGSGSRVRTSVFGRAKQNIGRALIAEFPVEHDDTEEFTHRFYRFDFRCVAAGVSGYCWVFPCLINGRPHLNLGIYDQNAHDGLPQASTPHLIGQLHAAFPELASSWSADKTLAFKAFPIRWYDARDQYVRGSTILAGDAAGVDPLMGEGISCAFEHGKLAASAISRYLDGDESALESYGEELHLGSIGCKLRRLAFSARRFYGTHHRFYFRLAGISSQLQRLGVDWYNGANGLDELSFPRALLRFLSRP
jgi:flavin-dependent dehydrogenase